MTTGQTTDRRRQPLHICLNEYINYTRTFRDACVCDRKGFFAQRISDTLASEHRALGVQSTEHLSTDCFSEHRTLGVQSTEHLSTDCFSEQVYSQQNTCLQIALYLYAQNSRRRYNQNDHTVHNRVRLACISRAVRYASFCAFWRHNLHTNVAIKLHFRVAYILL